MGKANPNFYHPNTWWEASDISNLNRVAFGSEHKSVRGYVCPRCAALVVDAKLHLDWHESNEESGA